MRLAALLFAVSTLGFAGNWSGYLVDAKCYHSELTNVSQDATSVSRDMGMALSQCLPKASTRKFAVVIYDWTSVKLDPYANEQAVQIVQHVPKHSLICVTVRGSRIEHHTVSGSVTMASLRRFEHR